jgi:hypothetical protein
MKKKLLYFSLFIVICVLGYVTIKSYEFHKYFNKLEISDSELSFKIEKIFNNNSLNIRYLKSLNYDKECIAYTAIIDNTYYITAVKLGKGTSNLKTNKILEDFKESNVIGIPLIDAEEQIGCYVNFETYSFYGKEIKYYIHGKEIRALNKKFPEIIFKGDYINFSCDNENKKDFGFVTPNEEMSVSFIVYKNELYAINMKSYKNHPFKSLHILLNEI